MSCMCCLLITCNLGGEVHNHCQPHRLAITHVQPKSSIVPLVGMCCKVRGCSCSQKAGVVTCIVLCIDQTSRQGRVMKCVMHYSIWDLSCCQVRAPTARAWSNLTCTDCSGTTPVSHHWLCHHPLCCLHGSFTWSQAPSASSCWHADDDEFHS